MSLFDVARAEQEILLGTLKKERGFLINSFSKDIALVAVKKKKEDMVPLPNDSPFSSYFDWEKSIEDSLKSLQKDLGRMDSNRALLICLKLFIEGGEIPARFSS